MKNIKVPVKSIWLCLMIFLPGILASQSLRSKVNEGNELYHSGEYEQAVSKYKDALLDDPLHETVLFNEADALFKMEKYPEAREEYQKILATKDIALAAKAHFNIGNTYFMENKLPESIESYKKALDLSPEDFDAKYNIELARGKLKEQSQKQQQNQDQNQQNKDMKPSEYAKRMKEQADRLVAQGLYGDALKLMKNALSIDQSVSVYNKYIDRLQNVVNING